MKSLISILIIVKFEKSENQSEKLFSSPKKNLILACQKNLHLVYSPNGASCEKIRIYKAFLIGNTDFIGI